MRSGSPARASTTPSTCSGRAADGDVAIRHASELRPLGEVTQGELRGEVARVAGGLRALGVGPGDRVVAYLPNIPEAIAAFLACASIGAIWSSCSPDFGARSVIDRFAQITPKVLLAVDGYRYGGKDFDRAPGREAAARVAADGRAHGRARLPRPGPVPRGPRRRARLGGAAPAAARGRRSRFEQRAVRSSALGALQLGHDGAAEGDRARPRRDPGRDAEEDAPPRRPARRRPAVLVHDDGLDDVELRRLGADERGARSCSTTATPARPTSACSGIWPTRPASRASGRRAAFIANCQKAGIRASEGRDLSRLRSVGSTGSPLSPEGFAWVYESIHEDIWLFSTSGGTDVGTAFVGGVPTLPVYQGELQARSLGVKLEVVEPGGEAADRRGRRARDHRADAVDADLLLGRRRRQPLPRELLRDVPRASGGTATGSRSPTAAPRSSPAAPTRRSTAAASGWARARSTGPSSPSTRSSTRSCSTCRCPAPKASCRSSSSSATAPPSTTTSPPGSASGSARTAPPATSPTSIEQIQRGPPHPLRQGARAPRQADPARRPGRHHRQPRRPRHPRRTRPLRGDGPPAAVRAT